MFSTKLGVLPNILSAPLSAADERTPEPCGSSLLDPISDRVSIGIPLKNTPVSRNPCFEFFGPLMSSKLADTSLAYISYFAMLIMPVMLWMVLILYRFQKRRT